VARPGVLLSPVDGHAPALRGLPMRQVPFTIVDVRSLADMASAIREALFRKVFIIINGKGGVGKSSLAAAFAAMCAAQGERVLLVEMDPQGNNAEDLGFVRNPELYDNGKAQADAVLNGWPLEPTGEARKRLWVAPGGEHLYRVVQELYIQQRVAEPAGDTAWMYMYGAALAQCATQFDRIILDVAPGSEVLQLQALVAGDMTVIPSRSDASSRKGLRAVAKRFRDAKPLNPDLVLLGIVLFGTGTRASRVRGHIREELAADVQNQATVFGTAIRYVEAVARQCRADGLVPEELARSEGLDPSLRESAKGLSRDYRAVTVEILKEVMELQELS
jgi:chromosome partitioning protein